MSVPWTTAIDDLRKLLFDDTNGKYFYRKVLIGEVNGSNLSFKSFEPRRLTDFTNAVGPLGVYVSGTIQPISNIASDDLITGEFKFAAGHAPTEGNVVEGTYYMQQFTDAELTSFLTNSCKSFLQLGDDFTMIPDPLQMAALNYTVSQCLLMLAMRWSSRASDTFLLEDAPKKESQGVAKSFSDLAQVFMKTATAMRNDSYSTRAGQTLQPNFRSNPGRVPAVTPRR